MVRGRRGSKRIDPLVRAFQALSTGSNSQPRTGRRGRGRGGKARNRSRTSRSKTRGRSSSRRPMGRGSVRSASRNLDRVNQVDSGVLVDSYRGKTTRARVYLGAVDLKAGKSLWRSNHLGALFLDSTYQTQTETWCKTFKPESISIVLENGGYLDIIGVKVRFLLSTDGGICIQKAAETWKTKAIDRDDWDKFTELEQVHTEDVVQAKIKERVWNIKCPKLDTAEDLVDKVTASTEYYVAWAADVFRHGDVPVDKLCGQLKLYVNGQRNVPKF